MLGVYDFNGHYDWTFRWLQDHYGKEGLAKYWVDAISVDSQAHARSEFLRGFDGMLDYWGHTLAEEGAGYTSGIHEHPETGRPFMRIDMQDCPSLGFLLRNGIGVSEDYCQHCMGWIGPSLADAGFVADHEHDHAGHCWWEIRESNDPTPPSAPGVVAPDDVRLLPLWVAEHRDVSHRSSDPEPAGTTRPR